MSPNSIYICITALTAWDWVDLNSSKTVIVPCESDIRGSDIAKFLRSKEIDAWYVEQVARG